MERWDRKVKDKRTPANAGKKNNVEADGRRLSWRKMSNVWI